MKKIICLLCTVFLSAMLISSCGNPSMGVSTTNTPAYARQDYANDRGIGFFYPEENARISGISKVYGLAYIDEGWLETERGVGTVNVTFGDGEQREARTYVKDRYWVRTFDTTEFPDGPLLITATAVDLEGKEIGAVSQQVLIDNSKNPNPPRFFAAADGLKENEGTKESPWDLETGINRLNPGDVLFLRGGTYSTDITFKKSGTENAPITLCNYQDEQVSLTGAGIDVAYNVSYINVYGLDQSGLRGEDFGANLAEGANYIEFWDCSFNDNTFPYETSKEDKNVEWGTGFRAEVVSGKEGENRKFITLSHCEAKRNDVDGFQLSSIDHGRFQFLESAHNPNGKTADIFQYKHANGFVNKNSDYQYWGVPSEDNVYLFCYSHHNGQDGWDMRSAHEYLYGCVTHDEAQAGNNFGGLGMKFWEFDVKVQSCLNFRNNLVDGTGQGMNARDYTRICNTAFYNVANHAVMVDEEKPRRLVSNNNIFFDFRQDFSSPQKSRNCIYFGEGAIPETNTKCLTADPLFLDPKQGNFFLKEGSPALTNGNSVAFTFLVDGVDYSRLDGLGRPRASQNEIGPYTRYPEDSQ